MQFIRLGSEFINLDHVQSCVFSREETGKLTALLTLSLVGFVSDFGGRQQWTPRTRKVTEGADELFQYLKMNAATLSACEEGIPVEPSTVR